MGEQTSKSRLKARAAALGDRLRLPALSGKASAAAIIVCFALTAVLIPMIFQLPQWIDFEIVLACWWAIWWVVLARLLYLGQRVSDDHQMGTPRNWFSFGRGDGTASRTSGGDAADLLFWGALGCESEAFLIIGGLMLLVGGLWFLIEIAIPLIVFLLYAMARGMLAVIVNDRHHCRGRLGPALGWALLWATVYTAPLAAGVWLVHFVYRSQNG